jgi:cytochrome c
MTTTTIRRAIAASALVATTIGAAAVASTDVSAKQEPFDVLVFSRTAGFRHSSIQPGIDAIEELGADNDFTVDTTEDPADFTPENLAQYEAIVFLHTTGNVLPGADQRAALEGYIADGGGWFGIHAASDMGTAVRTGWPFYLELVGAAFKGHTNTRIWADVPIPPFTAVGPLSEAPDDAEDAVAFNGAPIKFSSWEPAEMTIEDPGAFAMHGFGAYETRSDEWYGFRENPRDRVHVLASLDESTYTPGAGEMGEDHPVVWCQEVEDGRSVYTALGHPIGAWADDVFLRHVYGSIQMAAGQVPFNCDVTPAAGRAPR